MQALPTLKDHRTTSLLMAEALAQLLSLQTLLISRPLSFPNLIPLPHIVIRHTLMAMETEMVVEEAEVINK